MSNDMWMGALGVVLFAIVLTVGYSAGQISMSNSIVRDCLQWGGFTYIARTFNCTERKP